ncbi:MAG: Ig-like domain-containing protein, partial [Synechococcus sp.]|nr:Ig-like domain-containing protein [Synechococcus sp.]
DPLVIEVDTSAPQFGSSEIAVNLDENIGDNQLVYTVNSIDDHNVTYSLKNSHSDNADLFRIDSATGEVRIITSPDFETQPSYSLTVIATDAPGNASEQRILFTINDRNTSMPSLVSGDDVAILNGITNDTTPVFRGVGSPGALIEIFADGSSLGSTRVESAGDWTFEVPSGSAFGDGRVSITAVETVSESAPAMDPSDPLYITIDTLAPALQLELSESVKGGALPEDALDPGGVVSVHAEVGSRVFVTFTNGQNTVTKVIESTADVHNGISLTQDDISNFSDGPIVVSATAFDLAGNQSSYITTSFEYRAITPSASLNLTGTVESDFLWGGTADDSIFANAGHDYLIGLEGNDTLEGGLGNDTLLGGSGADRLIDWYGTNRILGDS